MLDSAPDVVRCVLTYTDWWQPTTGSVLVGAGRRHSSGWDGLRPGLIETLDERSELSRRMAGVDEVDRRILFLWYVEQLPPNDIARAVGVSRRQCYRRRAETIRLIVQLGEPQDAE